jgi:hypothetical protein
MLLERGHHQVPTGVKDKESARRRLQVLSLDLQEGGGQKWTEQTLDDQRWALRRQEPELGYRLKESARVGSSMLPFPAPR